MVSFLNSGAEARIPHSSMVRAYAEFEDRVHLAMAEICVPFCRTCKKPCCRVEFCQETITSLWLVLVRNSFPAGARYHSRRGWCSSHGCTLPVGRAPVCYEYFCPRILSGGDGIRGYALQTLGKLVSFVGQNALGGVHLVALLSRDDLRRVKPKRFRKRLQIAKVALSACRTVLKTTEATPADLDRMAMILKFQETRTLPLFPTPGEEVVSI